MKQNYEKIQTKRIFSWRGWPSWVKFLYKGKKYCPLLCCPKDDFKTLSPFAHKVDICSPGMKQNCEKMLTYRNLFEEDGWAGVNVYARLKSTIRCFIAMRSILSPCVHLSIKWTFVHMEWSKIVKKCRLSEFFLEEDGRAGKNSCTTLKSAVRCFVSPRSIFSPCLRLPIKWTFVHLQWSKIVK